jgi:short-subunit dehydrogenase
MKGPAMILGGRSDIGLAAAHLLAAAGHPIQLAARNARSLDAYKSDIEIRHKVSVSLHEFDALAIGSHQSFVDELYVLLLPEIAICAIGVLGDQAECERNLVAASLIHRSNFEGPASVLAALANRFEVRRSGTLVGISSVSGARGRGSNYVYGSAKAGFTAFLSGLRNRLSKTDVHVVTVLPGFVATKMTQGRHLPNILTATPDEVGRAIYNAVLQRQNVIYVKRIWRIIILLISLLPESIFKRLRM